MAGDSLRVGRDRCAGGLSAARQPGKRVQPEQHRRAGHSRGCGQGGSAGNLPVYKDGLLGTVTPIQTVTIHTRVDGQLIKVAFVEGQIVKKGDLLVQIDPNPFRTQLEQAQGQLAKDQASLKDAQLDLTRYKQAPEAYTAQQIDTQQALVDQDAGAVKSDQGAVYSARCNWITARLLRR